MFVSVSEADAKLQRAPLERLAFAAAPALSIRAVETSTRQLVRDAAHVLACGLAFLVLESGLLALDPGQPGDGEEAHRFIVYS